MENTNNRNANKDNNPSNEWLFAQKTDGHAQDETDQNDDVRSTAAEGFGPDAGERAYLAGNHQNVNSDDDDEEEENDENADTDWGEVDPLENPGRLSDPMDPSGPGSAV